MMATIDAILEWIKNNPIEFCLTIFAAVLAGGIYEILKWIFALKKRLKLRGISLRDHFKDIAKKFSSEKPLSKREVEKSITSKLQEVDKNSVIFSIDKKKAITINEKRHYKINGYHFYRHFSIMKILTGEEHFFDEACKVIGEMLNNLDFDYILYLDKDSDNFFSKEISKHCKKRRLMLGYKEVTNRPPEIIYRESENLEGQNIVVLSAFVLTYKPLREVIDFISNRKANLKKIGILFNVVKSEIETLGADIITAFDIDLKLVPEKNCERCRKQRQEYRVRSFDDY